MILIKSLQKVEKFVFRSVISYLLLCNTLPQNVVA